MKDRGAEEKKVTDGSIVFDHVWFKYRKEAKEIVLSDVSFEIPARPIRGWTRKFAAKTTLVQLIPRLYL